MTKPQTIAVTILGVFLLIGAAVTLTQSVTPPAAMADGKTAFLDAKCNTCHTISALGITKRAASAADAAETKSASAPKPPDLSSIGLERKAEWIGKFLMKTEAVKGVKHPRKYRGTEPQLKVLASWMETMKAPKKK